MMGTWLGIGAPGSQFGQAIQGTSPYGVYPFAAPFTLQTPPYLQSLQQIPSSFGIGGQPFGLQGQAYSQPWQLLQVLPQQLAQVNQLLQHQLHGLQQIAQVVPQQLHHIQQLLQILPQQIQQMQLHTQQQPFGTQGVPGFGAFSPWQQSGVGFSSPAFTGQGGPVM